MSKLVIELQKDIRAKNLGYVSTLGGFEEEDKDTGLPVKVTELSFIVPYNPNVISQEDFFEFAVDMCKKYNQDSVLFKYCNGTVGCFDKNGKFDIISSNFKVNKLSEYMTEVKKRNGIIVGSFVFENCSNFESICYTNSISALQHYMNAKKILENV